MKMIKSYTRNFFKYIIVGGSAAVVNWLIFFICTYLCDIYYLIAGLFSFILATLWNFIFARLFIFTSTEHSILKESTLVYLVSLGGLGIDMGVLFVCVEWLGLYEMLGKILSTGVAFIFNFSMRQFVIYK